MQKRNCIDGNKAGRREARLSGEYLKLKQEFHLLFYNIFPLKNIRTFLIKELNWYNTFFKKCYLETDNEVFVFFVSFVSSL